MEIDPLVSYILVQPSNEQSSYQSHFMSGVGKEHAYETFQLAYLIDSMVEVNKSLI